MNTVKDSKILIADPDQVSVVLLKDALRANGYTVMSALDGGRALEKAISEHPDLILADIALPIIATRKLTQILRANPHTEDIPMVFMSSQSMKTKDLRSYRDRFLLKPLDLEKAVSLVDSHFRKLERVQEVTRVDKEIEGDLSQIPLVDFLQILSMNKKDGTITISRDRQKGFIYLQDGRIINAIIDKIEGIKALFRLFFWGEGKLEFVPQRAASPVKIQSPTDNLLMEGMRQLDEWQRLKEGFPDADSQLKLKVDISQLPKGLRPITQEVFLLLEFYTRVEDIVDNCSFPDYEIYQTLQNLLNNGIIEEVKKAGKEKKPGEKALLPPELVLRIKEELSTVRRLKLSREFGKIVILPACQENTKFLVNACSTIPGFSINRELISDNGSKTQDNQAYQFGNLGSIRLSENVELEIFALPLTDRCKPMWRPFSHGMLGGILLFDKSSKKSLPELKQASAYFQEKLQKPLCYILVTNNGMSKNQLNQIKKTFRVSRQSLIFYLSRKHPEKISSVFTALLKTALE
jgi:CheY-like chemotaxis protein